MCIRDSDNGNVTLILLSSNYVENCLCPKWLLPESVRPSVTTLGIELLSQLKTFKESFSKTVKRCYRDDSIAANFDSIQFYVVDKQK